ncbi:MAG: ATP-dependent DNA helicase DinG [Treponema sp.]|jgi:ATP-dependent DNA helicase DinG|nr:ATP-dependent DNA helicase DinG [Treponema sp.]
MGQLDSGQIAAALRDGGSVASRLAAYEPRQAQLDLTALVVRAFNEDAVAAAEAGTGVGKSFAYLLPAIHFAMENDERVVISTATITLQQQLFEKDIPLVSGAVNKKIRAVLMKGRRNYLCRRRLADALMEPELAEGGEREELERIAQWAETGKSGSRSELSFVPVETLWSRICSEADLCMGMRCPEKDRCFVNAVKKEAADARLIVVNHHLLFADLAARRGGAGYEGAVVLPPYRRVIIDEAHTIEPAATSFFSGEFGRPGVFRLLGRLYRRKRTARQGLLVRLCSLLPAGEDRLDSLVSALEGIRTALEELDGPSLEICGAEGVFRLSPFRENSGLDVLLFPLMDSLRKKILAFTAMTRNLFDLLSEKDLDEAAVWEIKTIIRRLDAIADILDAFAGYRRRPNEVMWIERRHSSGGEDWAAFVQSPVDISVNLRESLFSPNKTVVCVSATLAVNGSFGYWAGRCGINEITGRPLFTGCFPSPFPYASEVLLAAPADAPMPGEAGWQEFVDTSVGKLSSIAGGSALILFTSYQSLRSAWQAAQPELQSLGIRCLKQGDDDRSRLMRTFLEDKSSVLFATDSFWEGVDAPGDTLRLVILCRLPFRSPSEPVFEARREALEQGGGNPFMELSLPEAVMKFKQGFGRLMRRSSDRGVVAVLDSRLLKKRYGEFFLQSLPQTMTSFTGLAGVLRDTERFLYS